MSGPNPDTLAALTALLEPAAVAALGTCNAVTFEASAAVSLKRIADALSGDNAYALNDLMENAGQAFAVGMRGR